MKKSGIIRLAIFIIAIVSLSACCGLKKLTKFQSDIKYTITPNPLEMHADSVDVAIKVDFPAKCFCKKAKVEATPVLRYEGGEKELKKETRQGEGVQENNKVIKYADGGSINYTDKFAFDEAYRSSKLFIKLKGTMKSKELQVPEYEAARGILATPSLVLFDSKTIAAKDNFVRNRSESKAADIHFVINQADIRNSEVTADDMKTFNEYIENLKKDPKRKITGMDISSYASPDGVEDLNTKLAGKRSESTVKKMKDEIKKAPKTKKGEPKIEYKPTDDEILALLKATSTPEDWEGFQKLMQESEIEDKRIILDVLKMHSDPEVREKEIKKLAKVYLVLADKILPKLRRSQMNLAVEITGFTDEELKYLAQNKADTLNAEELFFAATLFNDIIQKLKIYQTYCGVYPKDWRGPNNVGYCYFQQGKFSDAKKAFEDARAIDSKNTMILNNLGAVAIREGEFDKAIEYLESAAGAGKEVSYNLGIISIKKAGFKTPENDYNEAAGYFGSDCSFNAALAKLLAGNIDNVIKTIDCAENKDDALMYYLKAIVAARQENTDLMLNSLRTAIEKDASLSRKAKTDIEFLKYFDESTFKSIVQ